MSADDELARRRKADADRQRRWRARNWKARRSAFTAVRDAHLDDWKALCAAHRSALEAEGGRTQVALDSAVYRQAQRDLLEMHRVEYLAALDKVKGEA